MERNSEWLDRVDVHEEPTPHVKLQELLELMPESIKDEWEDFMRGRTGMHCSDGSFGIYACDFAKFANKLR